MFLISSSPRSSRGPCREWNERWSLSYFAWAAQPGDSGPKVTVTHSIFKTENSPTKVVSVYINQSTELMMKRRLCGQKSYRL